MKKRIQKKSEVLREGYIKGLREGMKVVNKVIRENENAELLDEGMLGQAWAGVKAAGKKLGSNFASRKEYNNNLSTKKRALNAANQDYDDAVGAENRAYRANAASRGANGRALTSAETKEMQSELERQRQNATKHRDDMATAQQNAWDDYEEAKSQKKQSLFGGIKQAFTGAKAEQKAADDKAANEKKITSVAAKVSSWLNKEQISQLIAQLQSGAAVAEAEEETDNAEDIAELCAESWDWRKR